MTQIPWYSISTSIKTEVHDPVDLAGAIAILARYMADYRPHYESGEEAMAASMFGFSRSPRDFIEITLNGPDAIDITVELPRQETGFMAKLRGPFRHEETATSSAAVRNRLNQYFTLTPAAFQEKLRNG